MSFPKDPVKAELTRKRMSAARKGVPKSEEHKRKIGLSKIGKPRSDETKRKLSIARTGKHYGPHSEETRRKIGESNKGKHHSIETRTRLSEITKLQFQDKRYSDIISEANGNRIISDETRNKIRVANTGKNNPMYGITRPEETRMKICESHIGGFWYGNIRSTPPQYCEKWKDVNPRVHAFFNYKCCVCGKPENGRSHIGHHVFYVKNACCWVSDDGIYHTNLNAKNHSAHDYVIGENPNYFVILCASCHGKTNGDFENRKKWAEYFRDMIDTQHDGKCFFTKEEMKIYTQPL